MNSTISCRIAGITIHQRTRRLFTVSSPHSASYLSEFKKEKTTSPLWNIFYSRANERKRSRCYSSSISSEVAQKMTPYTKKLGDLILEDGKEDEAAMITSRRIAISKAITLVESTSELKKHQADLLLQYLIQKRQQQRSNDKDPFLFRIGIAGPPGSGKSSFIEKLGLHILGKDADGNNTRLERSSSRPNTGCNASGTCTDIHRNNGDDMSLAVVCIDPSSMRSGGSILGDKTRMEQLSRHSRAFVRPSPNRGTLGGIASYTNDVVAICQLAGYPLVIVETVGLGQSEVDIDNTVDMSILLLAPGGGDSLQGVKKGIVEIADMIIVNKADDSNLIFAAKGTASDYRHALQFQRRKVDTWEPPVLLASALTSQGIYEIWEEICRFQRHMTSNGELANKRRKQASYWMWKNLQDLITKRTQNDPEIRERAAAMTKSLESGLVTPRIAASEILDAVLRRKN